MTHMWRSKEEYLIDMPTDAAKIFEKIARGINICSILEHFLNFYHPMVNGNLHGHWEVKIESRHTMFVVIELYHLKYPNENIKDERQKALQDVLALWMNFKQHTLAEFMEKYPFRSIEQEPWWMKWVNDVIPGPPTNNTG